MDEHAEQDHTGHEQQRFENAHRAVATSSMPASHARGNMKLVRTAVRRVVHGRKPRYLLSGATISLLGYTLLAVLAAEGVTPLETEGRPFDAARQIALEAVPATAEHPPGTVVRELRRGYLAGDRVLRYAEVAVAK